MASGVLRFTLPDAYTIEPTYEYREADADVGEVVQRGDFHRRLQIRLNNEKPPTCPVQVQFIRSHGFAVSLAANLFFFPFLQLFPDLIGKFCRFESKRFLVRTVLELL